MQIALFGIAGVLALVSGAGVAYLTQATPTPQQVIAEPPATVSRTASPVPTPAVPSAVVKPRALLPPLRSIAKTVSPTPSRIVATTTPVATTTAAPSPTMTASTTEVTSTPRATAAAQDG